MAGPTAEVVEGVRSAYNRIAEAYAAVNSGEMPGALLRLAHKLLYGVGPDARLVDVGCGVGRDMGWFESRGVQVVGHEQADRRRPNPVMETRSAGAQRGVARDAVDDVLEVGSILHGECTDRGQHAQRE